MGTTQINYGQDIDLQAQEQQLQRQQMLADLLRKQAMTAPQQQMVMGGNHQYVVPTSPWEGLSKLGQAYIASKMDDRNNAKQAQLTTDAGERRAAYARSLAPPGTFGDVPATPAAPAFKPMTQDDIDKIVPSDTPQASPRQLPTDFKPGQPAQSQQTPSVSPEIKAAWVRALSAYQRDPELGRKLIENAANLTNEQKNMAAMGQNPLLMGQLGTAEARKKGIIEYQPGTTSQDLVTGATRYQPKVGEGINLDSGGNASQIPGYAAANAGVVGAAEEAKARAGAGYDMITIQTPGGPVMVTKEQAVQMAGGGAPPPNKPVSFKASNGVVLDFNDKSPQQIFDAAFKSGDKQVIQAANEWSKSGGNSGAPAPTGQPGIPLQTSAQKEFADAQAKSANDYSTALNGRVSAGRELTTRLAEMRDAMTKFNAGAGTETRLKIAQMAQAIGASDKVINGIAGGDLASMQEFQKMSVTQAMEALKQAISTDNGVAGRLTQAEFQQFLKVNPNLSTDPRAIEKLFSFSDRQQQRMMNEQQGFDSWLKKGNNPAGWAAEWTRQNPMPKPPVPAGQPSPTKRRVYNPATGKLEDA